MKLKKINFTAISFLEDVAIEKVLVSNKISFGVKSYEYFFGYLDNNHKIKPLHIMLPKTTAYLRNVTDKLNIRTFDGK